MNKDYVLSKLMGKERDYGVTIILAVESGSRVYGFDSRDSDYDIRGIFIQPSENYIKLGEVKEQIDFTEGNEDYVFWDLRKALKLLIVSNPSILDWISSPIVYFKLPSLLDELNGLAKTYFSAGKYFNANYGLAKSHYRKYIENQDNVKSKVYLYTLRALGACRYVLHESFAPPVNFEFQREFLPVAAIEELIQLKKSGLETDTPRCNVFLNTLIYNELHILDQYRNGFENIIVPLDVANEFLLKQLNV